MNSIAVLFGLVIFLGLAFLPYLVTIKGSRHRTLVLAGCIALAILLIPSLFYQWDAGQAIMVIAWVGLFVMAIASRFSKA